MKVIYSDLDGTLLHLQTYSSDAARPALQAIRNEAIPLVFCTSKTRAEVEFWRQRFDNRHPFIVENGGAIYIPADYFAFAVPGAKRRDGYDVVEFGPRYLDVVESLRIASRQSGCEVLGFHDMTVADICVRTHLPVQQAEMAKRREYDEAFEILSGPTHSLLNAIEQQRRRWTRGDRFYHITGDNDKSKAVLYLSALYRKADCTLETAGIGDGHNDAAFLDAVDLPVIVQGQFAVALKKSVPQSRVTTAPGPHGWNEGVMQILAN